MKKNLYYRSMFKRRNAFKEFLYAFFYSICSVPRLLLEVWVRKNLGERYFSFSTAVITASVLFFIPILLNVGGSIFNPYGNSGFSIWTFLLHYLTWYALLAGFVYMCILRRKEVLRLPSVFDFARFSLSAGKVNPLFFRVSFGNRNVNIRQVETIIEPAFFFLIGFSLQVLSQPVGLLIMACAVCYSLSYFSTYHSGDHFIMDKIDEMIMNEEMVDNFSDALPDPDDARGVRFYGRIPSDPSVQRQLVDSIIVDGDFVEAR